MRLALKATATTGTRILLGLALAVGAGSCVQASDGSKVMLLLSSGVPTPGDDPSFGRPPPGTHLAMWAQKDGRYILLTQFTLVPVIDIDFPCFMEDEESRFPGLHS